MQLAPLEIQDIIRKRRSLRRELAAREGLQPLRVAVLGGSTTNELVDLWELHLLDAGFAPVFHQTEYGQFYEEAVHNTAALAAFAPDLVYIHTSYRNVQTKPSFAANEDELAAAVAAELARYQQMWGALETLGCQILQNNFETPAYALFGNLDAAIAGGATRYFHALNEAFARSAAANPRLSLQDVHSLSAHVGLANWFDPDRWFSYKLLLTVDAHVALARSLTAMVLALYGRSRKVLVLDLDNTLWGGVIGDDGARPGIVHGPGQLRSAEAYLARATNTCRELARARRDPGRLLQERRS